MIAPMTDFISTVCGAGAVVVIGLLCAAFFAAYIAHFDALVLGVIDDVESD